MSEKTAVNPAAIGALSANITDINSKLDASYLEYYGVYPNGHMYNQNFFYYTIPCWNPRRGTVTINSVYVYSGSGAFENITSSVTIEATSKATINLKITYDGNQVNKLIRVTYTIS